MESNPFAPPAARVMDAADAEPAPALWNPNAAANWSLLLTPLFGALLHMKNWQALNEPAKAAASKRWAIVSAVFLLGISGLGALQPHSQNTAALSRSGGFILLVVWYFGSARPQARYVKERFGADYPRKGWGRPFLCALAGFAVLVVAAMLVGVAVALLNPHPMTMTIPAGS